MAIGIGGNMGNNWGDGMGDFSGLVFNTSHSGGSEMRNSYGGNSRDETMAIGKGDTIDSIGFSITLFASPISIRMGISIRGNMGNNWGDGMGDFSGLVFNASHCGSPVYRNGERGNMRNNEAMAIGKRDTIDSVGISLTLFASPISISIRMGIMGNNWSDCMGDLGRCVFDSSHGGGPGYRHSKRGNMMCDGYMRKTVMIEKLGISLGFTFFASIPSPIIWVGMGGSRQGL